MEWLEVHIDTNHAGLEPMEIFLSANGVDGVVIDDEQDFQSFLENNHQYWDLYLIHISVPTVLCVLVQLG